jgi:hypothetical protein
MYNLKYSKLSYLSLSLILISILLYSCKDSSSIVGSGAGSTQGNATMAVTSPKNGDSLIVTSAFTIEWTSNSSAKVKIEFSADNEATWITIADNVLNTGSYLWKPIPNLVTDQGKIRISTVDNSANNISGGIFSVIKSSSKSIVLTKPNGGEVLLVNQPFRIEWLSIGVSNIKLDYSLDNGISWNPITFTYPADSSHYLWNPVPSTPSNFCLVRITDITNDSISDRSNSIFSISNPVQNVKSIGLITPSGGEQWIVGTINEIRWTSAYIDSVKLSYTIDGGANWNIIAAKVPSNGMYNWLVPNVSFRSDNCIIRVSEAKLDTPYASSRAFSIYSSKVLRLSFPNGGEFISQDTLITWVSSGIDNVNIEYTEDNGQNWNTIITNIPSTGAYFWHLPFVLPSTLARLRITDAADPTISDMSDENFNLGIKALKLLLKGDNTNSPSSGLNISWTGTNKITSVRIEYSADKGKSWNLIASNVPTVSNKINNYKCNIIPQGVKGNILIRLSDSKGKYSDKNNIIID